MSFNISTFVQNLSVDEVFEEYNREVTGNKIPARLFMYVIGQEVGDLYVPKHMACSNKGINVVDDTCIRSEPLPFY